MLNCFNKADWWLQFYTVKEQTVNSPRAIHFQSMNFRYNKSQSNILFSYFMSDVIVKIETKLFVRARSD